MNKKIVCDFSNVRVGDKVFSLYHGNKPLDEDGCNAIVINVSDGMFWITGNFGFYKNGSSCLNETAIPFCYWRKPEITIPPPPKRIVKKIFERWIFFFKNNGNMCHKFYDNEEEAKFMFEKLPNIPLSKYLCRDVSYRIGHITKISFDYEEEE